MDKRLIKKFLERKCTAEEEKKVVDWMHSRDFEPELYNYIEQDLMLMKGDADDDEDLQPLLQNILIRDQMELIDSEKHILVYPEKKDRSSRWLLRVAASLAILFGLAYLIHFVTKEVPVETQPVVVHTVKENHKGRRSTLFLPDGSVVRLNAASKIEYEENFNDSLRTVYLEGEAFFEVAKDSLKPFVVHTDAISVTALGTSFNVSSYGEESQIAVALESGRVVVKEESQRDKIYLEPGQLVEYRKNNSQFSELKSFSARSVYGWKDGILYFKSATLPEVISRLERWFGVEFIIEGSSPLSWSYTGEFDNQSLKSVLESLSFSQSFHYVIEDKTVKIAFKARQ